MRCSRAAGRSSACLLGALSLIRVVGAQTTDPWPVQVLASADRPRPVEEVAIRAVILRTPVTVELDSVPLSDALQRLAQRVGLGLTYNRKFPQLARIVSLRAVGAPIVEAFAAVLQGTGLELLAWPSGNVVLVETGRRVARGQLQQGTGMVAGRVTDASTRASLDQVAVHVEGTSAGTITAGDGRYTIRAVPAGTYHITARRVGYSPSTQTVTISPDSTVSANFILAATPATLNEVVVTGAGPQRRVELGNAIATINADSIVPTAPITSLTDLISGRAANVDVVQGTGIVGDGPSIRIRGRSSLTVPNDAILIIDGARADATPGGVRDLFSNNRTPPTASRLNDLSPDEIESVEVLRGPSAATEYGTDAANGVLVITTKRGRAGAPAWDFRTEQAASTMPVTFPDNYTDWGHRTDGSNAPTHCPYAALFTRPSLDAGTCAVDSVTRFQPLNNAATSVFATGYRGQYGLQVSGGTESLRYFLSGDASNETGPIRMPPSEVARVETSQGRSVPPEQRWPDVLNQVNLRGRGDLRLSSQTDVGVAAAYLTTSQRTPDEAYAMYGALVSGGHRDSLSGYGLPYYAPGYTFAHTSSEGVTRATGSVSGHWRPLGWLEGRGTVGLDDASRSTVDQLVAGQDPTVRFFQPGGYRGRGLFRTGLYTVDLGATARVALSRTLSSKTTIGAQYYDRREQGADIGVTNLTQTDPSLNGTTLFGQSVLELNAETKTAGSYIEETVGYADRLYVTGALREDAGSGFGSKYNVALYPKASISWVAVGDPARSSTTVRFRAAYGQSGVQPRPGAALHLIGPAQVLLGDGTTSSGDTLSSFGNPKLRPERSAELEGGADVTLFHERLSAELTLYNKRSTDALIDVGLPGSLGSYNGLNVLEENVGAVDNRGLELSATAEPIHARAVTWDVTVSGSINVNRLISLAPGLPALDQGVPYYAPYRHKVGYPLYGLWGLPYHYADLNHDGRIEPNEVTVADSLVFVGPSLPTKQLSVNTGISVLNHRVRLAGQIDMRGGGRLANAVQDVATIFQTNQALNDPHAPLRDQGRAVAAIVAYDQGSFKIPAGYVEDNSFLRLRELSLTYTLSGGLLRHAGGRSASVTVAGRNVAMWTKYTGSDPEGNNVASEFGPQLGAGGVPTPSVNHDIAGDLGAVPQLRYWLLRVNVGL